MPASSPRPPEVSVKLSILRTASIPTIDAFTYRGGSFLKDRTMAVSAILVQHPSADILFDSGLGNDADAQFAGNPWWGRMLLGYEKGAPASKQLAANGIPPDRISMVVLSHIHWDHASGVPDFPRAEILTTKEEHDFGLTAKRPAVIREQFDGLKVRWKHVSPDGPPYEGFERSLDLFKDGTVVLVPLPGHTPGSLGMFVSLASGKRFLFTGDLTWTLEGLQRPAERPLLLRWLVDNDVAETRRSIVRVHLLMQRRPDLIVVPAHDAASQEHVAAFPKVDR